MSKYVNLNDRVSLKEVYAAVVGIEHGFMGNGITTTYELMTPFGKVYVSREHFLTESEMEYQNGGR